MDRAKTVLVAMSGGVDSTVAALILKNSGRTPYGVTMRLLENADTSPARTAAAQLGIPFEAVDYREVFEKEVINEFIASYLKGETPNPCITCNRRIKFGVLFNEADRLGIKYLATGHYAQIEEKDGVFRLKKAKCVQKDQSYFLYRLNSTQLSRILFPLGGLSKEEVRTIAAADSLENASKKDSQDICFINDGDYVRYIIEKLEKPYPKGVFLDKNGNVIGKNDGMICYTIGQRRGLGTGFGKRIYVTAKNAAENTVTLGLDEDLYVKKILLKDVFYGENEKNAPFEAKVRIRYRHTEQEAVITPLPDFTAWVEFRELQRAPAAGQSAVFYEDDYVTGGGEISG